MNRPLCCDPHHAHLPPYPLALAPTETSTRRATAREIARATMSRIWNDRVDDRATSTPTQQTIDSNNTHNSVAAFINDPSSSSGASAASSTSATPSAAIPPPPEMPTSSIQPSLGNDPGLTTTTPGLVDSSGSSSSNQGSRARSEPPPPKDGDGDVEMVLFKPRPRACSEYAVRIPAERPQDVRPQHTDPLPPSDNVVQTANDTDAPGNIDPIEEEEEEESSQSLFNARRAPSPALTEADNQDPQYIFGRLDTLRIHRRDYAFALPYASKPDPEVFQGDFAEKNAPKLSLEVFDQFKALTEVDYRFSQPARTYPISGKTLHHLLEMKWLSEEDFRRRGHPMDFEELERFKSRPIHPWRPFKTRSAPDSMPSEGERRDLLTAKRGFWMQFDKQRFAHELRMKALAEERRRANEILTEADRRWTGKGKARETSPSNKRPLEEDTATRGRPMSLAHDYALQHGFPPSKRRRITPERYLPHYNPLYPTNPALDPHRQQIMPSVPRPAGSSQPRPGERADTPPIEDPSSQESQSQGEDSPPGRQKLVHPRHQKAMRRALSRTQTLQLIF